LFRAARTDRFESCVDAPTSKLETLKGLEQLRRLAAGIAVRCIEVDARGRVFQELKNPGDVARIEAALEAQ
jgi:3-deoxy-manno-octulosonate cytidylyltransferase (CMP-KDO synthetase)